MNRKTITKSLAVVCLGFVVVIGVVASTDAAPQSWPNGPWVVPQQEDSLVGDP